MSPRTPRARSALLLSSLATALLACGEPPAVRDRTVFLTNLPAERVEVSGHDGPVDLHDPAHRDVSLREAAVEDDRRRVLVQLPGVEVRFRDVLRPGARLETALLPRGPVEEPGTYRLEVSAVSKGGDRSSVWSGEISTPESEEARTWQELSVPLPEGPGDLVLSVEGDASAGLRKPPGWANPRVVVPDVPVARARRPANRNLVVFLVDTLRQDHLGLYGYDRPTSPNLDALASESIVFTAAHAGAPWTKASVATLFTGEPPSRHGTENFQDRLSDAAVTLAETFHAAGYETCAVGHNGWVFNRKFNLTQGFEQSFFVVDHVRKGGARADSVVAEAIDWLRRERDEPFFLYVHTIDPHEPYAPAEAERRDFLRRPYGGPLTGQLEGPGSHAGRSRDDLAPEDLEFLHDLYDAEIRFTDERLGELVDFLKSQGVWEETTFVVTADHGEEFLDHGAWSHGGSVYQEMVLVPLLIKPAASLGLPTGRIDEPVSLADLAPTLCRMVGLSDESFTGAGRNLLPLVVAPDSWEERVIVAELNKEGQQAVALRRGSRKYVRTLQPRDSEMLFDLERDPGERTNLAGEATEDELEAFRNLVTAHLASARERGIVLELLGDGSESEVELRVTTNEGELDYGLVDAEREGDGFHTGARGEHVFVFHLGGEDRRDGVRLLLADGQRARVTFRLREGPDEPKGLLLGPEEIPFKKDVIELAPGNERLRTEARPPWEERPGLWCRVWDLRPAEVELDEEEARALKALGYLGD